MRKLAGGMLFAVLVSVLAACAPNAGPAPSSTVEAEKPTATVTPIPDASPTPSIVFADPAGFTTHFVDRKTGDPRTGVDFNSADNNVHCGIFDGFTPVGPLPAEAQAFGGCVPQDRDYEAPRPVGTNENIGCHGAFVTDVSGPTVICNNGAAFMGDGGVNGNSFDQAGNPITIEPLPTGQGLQLYGITCEALDAATIRCTVDATKHGFTVSRSRYSEF